MPQGAKLNEYYTLYPGNRDGYLVSCNRCRSMNFFPWMPSDPARLPAWLNMHDLWCPAVLDAALLRLQSGSTECSDTAAAAAPEE